MSVPFGPARLKQFITWRPEPREGGKLAKVPFEPTIGKNINPLNSASWLSYEAAQATGHRVGFVLTENDKYAVIDIDGCYDPHTGQWSELAQRAFMIFKGAFFELSVSGTGIHIWFTFSGDPTKLVTRWPGCEFYFSARFIALGTPIQGTGSADADMTEQVLSFVPRRLESSPVAILTAGGPVPEYTGPADDLTLLAKMFEARGSAATVLGHRATLQQIWLGDVPALAKDFPTTTPDEPFDRSAVDLALLMHLAFWTGKDAARMERLWQLAPVTKGRTKLDRPDYVARTINKAIAGCNAVYDRPAKGVPALHATAGATGGYMTLIEQAYHFRGCTYVEADNAIFCENDGLLRDRERFKVVFGGFEFQMQADGSRPTRDAWECFTQNRAVKYPRVLHRTLQPNRPYGHIENNAINTFRPPNVPKSDGDVTRFLDLLKRMIPNENDRLIFLSWCASMVQNPGRKFQWAVVIQGTQGNGKTFLLKCLEYSVGPDFTHLPNPEDMNEKFNTFLEGTLLIGVEEIHMGGRRDMLDRLKKYITNDRIEIRGMNRDKRMAPNLTNWLFLTNYQDAVLKSRDDRRYAIFFTAQQEAADLIRDGMDGDYFPTLWKWAREGGFAAVAGFLSRMAVPAALDPAGAAHRAPETSSTGAAIVASYGAIESELLEAVEQDLQGFRGGWISTVKARAHINVTLGRTISKPVLGAAIRNIGFVPWGRAPESFQMEGSRSTIYCRPEQIGSPFSDYMKAQGYNADIINFPHGRAKV
jgi:hypothetical protein